MQASVTEYDMVPLPSDRARQKLAIVRTLRDRFEWLRREITVYFDWNEALGQNGLWTFRVELENYSDRFGDIISRRPVLYSDIHRFRGYVGFIFIDLSQQADTVTPETLGDTVSLAVIPGPDNPGYDEWVSQQHTEEQ